MKIAMMVTMAMTPIANFIMNHTSCFTTRSWKVCSAWLVYTGPVLMLRYRASSGNNPVSFEAGGGGAAAAAKGSVQ
jgi:hypothetical protein